MSRLITILVLVASMSAAGCATGTYHPTKPRSEWAKDHKDCEKQVRAIVREEPDLYGEEVDREFFANDRSEEQLLIKECMRRKGWTSRKRTGD